MKLSGWDQKHSNLFSHICNCHFDCIPKNASLHLAAFQIQLTILLMQPLLCTVWSFSQTSHRVECAISPVSPLVVFLFVFAGAEVFSFSSVQFSRSVGSDSLRPHESQHARPPCPSPTPGVYSNSCPSSRWCHPAISSSVLPFSSCPQPLPASGSFPMSQSSNQVAKVLEFQL